MGSLLFSTAGLEREAPVEKAELDVWESAFLRMQQGTGEGDADRLVARFLAEEEVGDACVAVSCISKLLGVFLRRQTLSFTTISQLLTKMPTV